MRDLIERRAAIDEAHKAIYEFFDICDDDEESPMTYRDEKLLEINKAITIRIKQLPSAQPDVPDTNVGDINKFIDGLVEIFADIRESHVDDSVCGLCEFDGAYIGESGDWCNECPGFNRDDCFKLRDGIRNKWIAEITKCLPSAQQDLSEYSDKLWRAAYERGMQAAQLEIVYCRECIHWRYDTDHTCRYYGGASPRLAIDFCSKGEMREDEQM